MAKITYVGPLPSRCGFSVKDITTTLRKMAATYLLKKLNSEIGRFPTICFVVAVGGTTTFDVPLSLQNMSLVLEESSEFLCK